MRDITTDMIREWIDQCDSQLKLLQNAKNFIHREYYENDSIGSTTEEDLRDYFNNLIRDHKTKKQFPYMFEDRITNRLPEYLQKEFYNFVYKI
jgi:hypothetical protein